MGSIKDKKLKDLTEADEIKKNAQKNCTKTVIKTRIGMMLGSLM